MHQQPCIGVLVLLLLCTMMTSLWAFQCPQGQGCSSCNIIPNGEYEIVCRSSPINSAFLVKYKPKDYISITCINSPNWDNFYLGEIEKIQHVDAIYFKMCELPRDNHLSVIVKKLVTENVDELDFRSYNNITTSLSRSSLKDFNNVKKLTLSSNSLANVPHDLFEDLSKLKLLNVQENNLSELPKNFLNLPTLEAIELSNNKLEIIEEWAFEKLKQLKLLNLWNNKLNDIKPHSFDKLINLLSIDLQNNRLIKLPSNIFSRMTNLRSINLSKNNFTAGSLPDDLFHNNSNLVEIKLFDNKQNLTTLPKQFFGNLTKLTTLSLRRNGLIHLPENLLWGAVNLKNLNIERNYLLTLPVQFFRDCDNLTILDLSFNDIQYLPDGVFAPLRKLTSLNLSKNRISSITANLLSDMSSLTFLNMERNNMKFIDSHAMRSLQNLRIAKFSYNQLNLEIFGHAWTEFGSISPFEAVQSSIEELYLSHNNITQIFSDWNFATQLKTLDLSYNKFRYIRTEDLQFLSNVNIDLTFNEIESIELVNNDFMVQSPRNVIVNVENNPIKCDCNVYNVLRYQEGRLHPSVQNLFDLRTSNLRCNGPRPYKSTRLSSLKSKTFRCEIDSFYRNASCPLPCDCTFRPETKSFLINCAHKGFAVVPRTLKAPTRSQDIKVELDLSKNYLKEIPPLSQWGYDKLTVLSLVDNHIENISISSLPKSLEVLHLASNNLTRLNSEVITFLSNSSQLKNITLDRNPWICDCDARDFLRFIQTKRIDIPDLQKVKCNLVDKPTYEFSPDELCPIMIEWIIGGCIGVAFLGIIIGCIAAMYYRYQHEIKVWLFARQCCLCLVTEDELDKDKLYDAFISYSHKDDDFIMKNFMPKLENGPNSYKLCVHYRDWLAGEWIPTQITRSVEDSRRTIVVLSPNFMESVWGRMEFRAAHKQALSEGRARLIVILYGDIGPTESLDSELKSYLAMNTYIRWGDPWFWEKLRYAMPHSTAISNKKRRKQTIFQTHQPKIHTGNDKSELIDTSRSSGTPSQSSTPPYNTLTTLISMGSDKNAINDAFTKELNESVKDQQSSAILSNVDNKIKNDTNPMMPQWTNV